MKIVNGQLLAHPLNWLTVLLMVLIAGMAGHLVLDAAGIVCPHNANENQ